MEQHARKPATGHEIRQILGPVDNETVIDILHTGASVNDVLQALTWLENDESTADALRHLTPKAQQVCEILVSDRDEPESLFH